MAYDEEKLREAEKLVASFEKKLYSAETALKSASEVKGILDSLLDDARKLKKLSYEDDYKDIIRREVGSKKLEESFSRVMSELSLLNEAFFGFGKKEADLSDVFSSLKNTALFEFADFSEAASFVCDCFTIFPDNVSIAPLYIGLLNLDAIASLLSLEKQKGSFHLGEKPVSDVLRALGESGIKSNFSIINDSLRLDFLNTNLVKVIAEPSKIKRLQIVYSERKKE